MKIKNVAIILITFFCAVAVAQKNVAVLEIERYPDIVDEVSRQEAMEITGVIRSEAVRVLPRARYNVMTSETVMSMSGAVLADCADENCIITIGRRIDADYVVRGTIRKFQTRFTLNVEMFETEYGNLVATATPIRSANLEEILDKSAVACANMYREFLKTDGQETQPVAVAPQAPMPPIAEPSRPPREERAPKPAPAPKPKRTPKPAPAPKPERAHRPQREPSWYVSARYQPPVTEWQILDAEGGRRFENGMSLGLGVDFNIPKDGATSIGTSLNYGAMTFDIFERCQLMIGGSGNYRRVSLTESDYIGGGPLVKIRWRFFELTYRGLAGAVMSSYTEAKYTGDGFSNTRRVNTADFVYINQLMIGLYFATSK